jgi:hypothetical protein
MILLDFFYFFLNPYRVCRKFLQKQGAVDIYQYGETPLSTINSLCVAAGLSKKDHFFELGAGRGKTAFFIRKAFGCKVTAIEQIPLFVRIAKWVNRLSVSDIEFRCEDFLTSDLSEASLIYLYGTCLPDDLITGLCKKFLPHQKIISISYPLSDYDPRYKILATIPVTYPWGVTEAYINSLVDPSFL